MSQYDFLSAEINVGFHRFDHIDFTVFDHPLGIADRRDAVP
jgi:hypothetical protein